MRLLVISYLIYTKNNNAYFLAIALPVFSFLFAGHPTLFKFPHEAMDLILNNIYGKIFSHWWSRIYWL